MRSACLLAAVALPAMAAPAAAGTSLTPIEFELSRSIQQTLARVQELWLQWVGATLQDNRARSDSALRGLQVAAREIGFEHFPDLSLGAVAQARQSLAAGNLERAHRQIAAANALDPGRPEVAFLEAAAARAAGDWLGAGTKTVRGFSRSFRGPEGAQLAASVGLWSLLVLQVSVVLFVGLLAAIHGPAVIRLLHDALSPPLPAWAASGTLVFLLVGPLVLPSGLFWVLMIVSATLWSFANRAQRAVLAVGWILVIATPLATDTLQRSLTLDHSPPMRALTAFRQDRLYGGFFSDLQVLRTALPEVPAANELVADVHRTLGQWDLARNLYRRVLYAEPNNVPVLLNLGAYYFRKGDHAVANDYFLRATRAARPSAAAWYNLSLGYSDAYMFEESRDALAAASAIDSDAVAVWIATENPDRVLTFNGSLGRRQELRQELVAAWRREEPSGIDTLSSRIGLGAVAGALLFALAFAHLRKRAPAVGRPESPRRPSALVRWTRTLVPAIEAVERGGGPRPWANLILLSGIALLPIAFDLTGDALLAGWSGPATLRFVAVLAALVYLAVRIRVGWLEATE